MARRTRPQAKLPIESYDHRDKERLNNPPVGLVTPQTDRDAGRKTYSYDPHLDPQLQWAGKAEHTSFEVPTVSLHVHERIDPRTIIEAVRKRNGDGASSQGSLWELPEENPPVRNAIEFYKHRRNWSNRLISGDSLLVMNSLLEKEGMAGKVQMIYIDPPYGIRYGSNFQPFVNRRDVRDRRDDDLTHEPETIKAFRDTWELGIHSYLSYLRDRLLLTREMLSESGSVFVQISDENVHLVRGLMDEVFGVENFCRILIFSKTSGQTDKLIANTTDFLLWYAKDKTRVKFRAPYAEKKGGSSGSGNYRYIEFEDGSRRTMTRHELSNPDAVPTGARIYRLSGTSSQTRGNSRPEPFEFEGNVYRPESTRSWSTTQVGLTRLAQANRLVGVGNTLTYVRYLDDFAVQPITDYWQDTGVSGFGDKKLYVVQTLARVIQRCILMTTDPGDLVFDPTCGSGTTAYVSEQWGRRWITCDTSRVAITLAQQRLMTASFDYYELAQPGEGVGSGLKYKTVPHVTLGSIANNPDIREGMTQKEIDAAIARHAPQETLYDQPLVDRGKRRVTGPFSVEAVPSPVVMPIDEAAFSEAEDARPEPDDSVSRSGETLRQSEWRDELLKTGIRGKAGQFIHFSRLEPIPGCRHLHADGETLPNDRGAESVRDPGAARTSQRVVVSFGPDHAPLEQRQVSQALEEAHSLVPMPKVIVFAAFQFDPEAAKDIDETRWPGVSLLKAQMNADLLTEDLKRKRASNESFWLIGQPDVLLHRIGQGHNVGKWQVCVRGFDYYNTKSGQVESGGEDRIAAWMLDTDYDGRSLYPRQVFFPMSGARDGWNRLARNLKAGIDEGLIESYRGTVSLPFEMGERARVAVKIVDDRGIESLRVIEMDSVPGDAAPSEQKSRTLEEIIVERGRRVPDEEWARVPADLIDRLDFYTSGADV